MSNSHPRVHPSGALEITPGFKWEEFEDTKWIIRFCKSEKERQHNSPKEKKTRGQTMIYKTLHIKLKINWRCGSHIFLESGEHKLSHSSIANSKGKV
jgi:hypothetical protein